MNNKTTFKKAFLMLTLGVFFVSCISNVEETIGEDLIVSFKNNVKPILEGRCLSCHSSGGIFPELTSYEKVKAHTVAIRAEVSSREMPKGGSLTVVQIKSIVDWIDEDALDN